MKPLSTGKIKFEIPFDNGDICVLNFNPNDIMFYDNLLKMEDKLKKIFEEYEKVASAEGTAQEFIEKLKGQASENIKAAFDDVFGVDAGKQIFKYCSPISFVEDEYYPFYFINAFTPEIVKQLNKTAQSTRKKMEKHIAKYRR